MMIRRANPREQPREQTEEKMDARCAAIWRRSVGRNSRQGSMGKKRTTNWWWAETKTTTHLMGGCQRSKQTNNAQCAAASSQLAYFDRAGCLGDERPTSSLPKTEQR